MLLPLVFGYFNVSKVVVFESKHIVINESGLLHLKAPQK